jgi:peroxiredoxin Q/BCP
LSGTDDISLSDFHGKKAVLLYFMREFACHTCVGHVLELARANDQLGKEGVAVLVIGGGNVDAAKRMATRYNLPFPVLADPGRTVYGQYGLDRVLALWQKSGSFLVDCQGNLRYANSAGKPSAGLDLAEIGSEIVRM